MSTKTRIPSWRPASPQPWGSLDPMRAKARDTEQTIVIRALTVVAHLRNEAENVVDNPGVIDPRPVARPFYGLQIGVWEYLGESLGEASREVGVAVAPEDQRGTGELVEVPAGRGKAVGVAGRSERP